MYNFARFKNVLKKPPLYIVKRIIYEIVSKLEYILAPLRNLIFTPRLLAKKHGFKNVDNWWYHLSKNLLLC